MQCSPPPELLRIATEHIRARGLGQMPYVIYRWLRMRPRKRVRLCYSRVFRSSIRDISPIGLGSCGHCCLSFLAAC